MEGSGNDNPPPTPPPPTTPQTAPQQAPHTVSTIKLPILKKGEYDIWAIKMEHYLAHTDYPIWEVIQKGNGPVSVTTDTDGVIRVLPPRTAEETLARERERKARTILLMALPEDHLAKFHKMTDAKDMWEAIKFKYLVAKINKRRCKGEEPKAISDLRYLLFSKQCVENYAKLKKLYDEQREKLNEAVIEIQAYSQGLKKVEAQLVTHQNNQLWYEEKIKFMKIDLDDKTDVLTYHKKLLAEAQKEKEDLKAKNHLNLPKQLLKKPQRFACEPKVWTDAPIIEEYESDSDDDCVSIPLKEIEQPSFAVDSDKHVKTSRENVKDKHTHSQYPKVNKKDLNESKRVGLGYGFTRRACFVCGSFSHLIRDCDYHEKRMAKQVELNKQKMAKGNGSGESKPKWNNVQRMNHQNQFVPTAVLTRTGRILVNTAINASITSTNKGIQKKCDWQTATSKESSNPFMAGSLPKTIHFFDSLQSDKDSFELIKLMILGTNFLTMGRIDDADAEDTFIDETLNDARNKNNKISNSKVEDDKETALEVKKCLDTSSW
ncbi:hypothetical protein Tco_1378840 [Tanacetum coccineum]